jgi:hypothetical protein
VKFTFPSRWPPILALSLVTALFAPATASADYVVMTNVNTADATINGAIYSVQSAGSGTGVYPAFVQLNPATPTPSISPTQEQAYNTTVNKVLDNGSSSTFNHEIKAGGVAVKTIGGTQYLVFSLDVNESVGGGNNFISLDSLKIYTSSTPNQSTTNPDLLGAKQYDMDGAGDKSVLLDYSNFTGSGTSDLIVLIPKWAGFDPNEYVYLYSAFGAAGELAEGAGTGTLVGGGTYSSPAGNYGVSDGFEEWAESLGGDNPPPPQVPAPASLILFAIGGGCCFGVYRRRKLQAA